MSRCQYPSRHNEKRCESDARLRVQLGIYAGAWNVCERHAGPVIKEASQHIHENNWHVSVDIIEAK